MQVEELLGLLQQVRKTGKGWYARCPAHEDKHASLSVAVADSGVILLHDFAGCDIKSICAALGIEPGDLFPDSHARDMTRDERAALNRELRVARWSAALREVQKDIYAVEMAASMMARGRKPSVRTRLVLQQAFERLHDASVLLK